MARESDPSNVPDRSRPPRPEGKGPGRSRQDPAAAIRERPRFHMAFLMLAILGVILLRDLWTEMQSVEQIPFSEFEKLLDEGQISEVVVQDDLIRGVVKKPLDGGKKEFVTRRV